MMDFDKFEKLQNEVSGVINVPVEQMPSERIFTYGLVRSTKPDKVVEIGVSAGVRAVVICRALRHNGKGLYVGVDNWSKSYGGRADTPEIPKQNILKDGTPEEFFRLRKSDGREFLEGLRDNSVDIVIIDGNHTTKYAIKDSVEAMRVARKLVLVHDSRNLEEVTDACKSLAKNKMHGVWIDSSRGFWMCDVRKP